MDSETIANALGNQWNYTAGEVKNHVGVDEFLAALNRLESINDYRYYLTKNYWTFVCISDSIFI